MFSGTRRFSIDCGGEIVFEVGVYQCGGGGYWQWQSQATTATPERGATGTGSGEIHNLFSKFEQAVPEWSTRRATSSAHATMIGYI